MHYKIKLSEMEFRAYHGCYELEQQVGNRFAVNLELAVSCDDVMTDDVASLVSYLTVYEIVAEQMKRTQCTIECVAQNIINALKQDMPQIEGIECEVTKIAPPLGGKIGRVSVVLKE